MSLSQFGNDLLDLINTDRYELDAEDFLIKYNIESEDQLYELLQGAYDSSFIDDYGITLEKSIEIALYNNGYTSLNEFINFLFEITNEC
jgi:hypothetical protein